MQIQETIAEITARVISQITPALQQTLQQELAKAFPQSGQAAQAAQLQDLQTELTNLKTNLANLTAGLLNQQGVPTDPNRPDEQSQPARPASQDVDEERAERWLRENTDQWLDQSTPFKRAHYRTWRELSLNEGPKIRMNGKGEQSPRAYLHAIESWKEGGVWNRAKARIALELGKAEESSSHYGRPEEIGIGR